MTVEVIIIRLSDTQVVAIPLRRNRIAPSEPMTLNKRLRADVDAYWGAVTELAESIINEFDTKNLQFDLRRYAELNTNIRSRGTLLNNIISDIADGRVLASRGFCKHLYEQLQGLPDLIRTANQAERDYHSKENAAGRFPVRHNFLVGMDKTVQMNILDPLKTILARSITTKRKRSPAQAQLSRNRLRTIHVGTGDLAPIRTKPSTAHVT